MIAAAAAVNAPVLSEVVIRHALAAQKGVIIRDVHIARQKFSWPGRLAWQDVRLVFEINAKKAVVQMPLVTLSGLESTLSSRRLVRVDAQGVRLEYDTGKAVDATLALALERDEISGPVTMGTLAWEKWQARDVSFVLAVNAAGIAARDVKLRAYDGSVSGKVVVGLGHVPVYALELFIDGLDLARMAPVNAGLADQLSGRVKGSLKLEGSATALRAMDADLRMPEGGKISAVFLAALTRYLPRSPERERLELLVNNGGKLAMEGFSFTMKSGREGRFSGEVHLRSRAVNLELNLTHEIHTDGTLASLLAYAQRVLR